MGKIRSFILASMLVIGVGVVVVPQVGAIDVFQPCTDDNIDSELCSGNNNLADENLAGFIRNIINVLLFLIGAIAVIMIIIGGINYTTSAGDPKKTKVAKDTILYSVIGLVVALLAYAIVGFVVDNIKSSGGSSSNTPSGPTT